MPHIPPRNLKSPRANVQSAPPAAAAATPAAVQPVPARLISRAELPRLDLLRTFESAARTLSFTRAASELALTQSAVSKQIQLLEDDLGLALFERRHRSLALTEAGEVLSRAASDCLERLRDATARMRQSVQLRQVSITTTAGFASLWLIPRLVRFTALHPQVDVRISATSDWLDLDRAGVDLAVRFCSLADGEGEPLVKETLAPMCAPSLLKNKANPLRAPADLSRHVLLAVQMPAGMALTADWEPWLAAMRLGEPHMKSTMTFSQYTDAVAAAVAGQGVVIGRLPLLKDMLADGRLTTPFGRRASSRRGYFIASSARARANPDAQAFASWLREEARQFAAQAAA